MASSYESYGNSTSTRSPFLSANFQTSSGISNYTHVHSNNNSESSIEIMRGQELLKDFSRGDYGKWINSIVNAAIEHCTGNLSDIVQCLRKKVEVEILPDTSKPVATSYTDATGNIRYTPIKPIDIMTWEIHQEAHYRRKQQYEHNKLIVCNIITASIDHYFLDNLQRHIAFDSNRHDLLWVLTQIKSLCQQDYEPTLEVIPTQRAVIPVQANPIDASVDADVDPVQSDVALYDRNNVEVQGADVEVQGARDMNKIQGAEKSLPAASPAGTTTAVRPTLQSTMTPAGAPTAVRPTLAPSMAPTIIPSFDDELKSQATPNRLPHAVWMQNFMPAHGYYFKRNIFFIDTLSALILERDQQSTCGNLASNDGTGRRSNGRKTDLGTDLGTIDLHCCLTSTVLF